MNIISASNVTLTMHQKSILKNITLDIIEGETLTLLGLNGAGKSSLIRILAGIQKPTQGEIHCDVQHTIAFVDQNASVDQFLSIVDNFVFQGELYQLNRPTIRSRMEYLIEVFELSEFLHKPIPLLSGGMKRRVDLAVNLISHPDILFLDEPTAALDLQAKRKLWQQLTKFQEQQNTTMVLTTHDLEEAECLSHRMAFLQNGSIVKLVKPDLLNQMLRQKKIILYAEKRIQEQIYGKLNGIHYESDEQTLEILAADPDQLMQQLIHLVDENKLCIDGIIQQKRSLRDLFMIFTRGGLANDQCSKENNEMALI